jgi:hypothetical protein
MADKRRIYCYLITLTLPMLITLHLQAQIKLVSFRDPDFESQVNSYFPGVLDISGYREKIGLITLLKNDGPTAARAYTVLWRKTEQDGNIKTVANATYMYRFFQRREDIRSLRPGQVRLITPFINISSDEYRNSKYFDLGILQLCFHKTSPRKI